MGNSRKTGLEQYYTNPKIAEFCVNEALEYIKGHHLYEPCAGTGSFLDAFEKAGWTRSQYTAWDIEPRDSRIKKGSFLDRLHVKNPVTMITNPPFGRNHSLSTRFFNHGALMGFDYICFLIPASWRKWSVQNKLDLGYHLVKDVDINEDNMFFGDFSKGKGELKCIFQVWKKENYLRKKVKIKDNGYLISTTPDKANLRIIQQSFDSEVGRPILEFDKTKRIAGNNYYIATNEAIDALKIIFEEDGYRRFKDACAYYTKSISLNEINFKLNEYYERDIQQ